MLVNLSYHLFPFVVVPPADRFYSVEVRDRLNRRTNKIEVYIDSNTHRSPIDAHQVKNGKTCCMFVQDVPEPEAGPKDFGNRLASLTIPENGPRVYLHYHLKLYAQSSYCVRYAS